MYRFINEQCQAKNDDGVEKVATIFSALTANCSSTSNDVTRMEKCERQSSDEIVPAMRKNSGAQASSKKSKQAEERTEDREQKHAPHTFIPMRTAEDQS